MEPVVVIRARCAVCNTAGDPANMLDPYENVPVHRIPCWEMWIKAEERQRVDWVVRLLRPQ
jgi:hypothetical protein